MISTRNSSFAQLCFRKYLLLRVDQRLFTIAFELIIETWLHTVHAQIFHLSERYHWFHRYSQIHDSLNLLHASCISAVYSLHISRTSILDISISVKIGRWVNECHHKWTRKREMMFLQSFLSETQCFFRFSIFKSFSWNIASSFISL